MRLAVKQILGWIVVAFALAGALQLFLPRALPNAIGYCACALIIAYTRKTFL